MKNIYELTEAELINQPVTFPGRVRSFLLSPEKGTSPISCKLIHWKNGDSHLGDFLRFITLSLKGGAGVKVIFGADTELGEPVKCMSDCYISSQHPEHTNFINEETVWSPFIRYTYLSRPDINYYHIEDSLDGENSITSALTDLIENPTSFKKGYDFSKIRPIGSVNQHGLVASGATSFAEIFDFLAIFLQERTMLSLLQLLGVLNDRIRRGGVYKGGIITSSMDYRCALIQDYIDVPTVELEGSHKKGYTIDRQILDLPELLDKICRSRDTEGAFIAKRNIENPELEFNVCMALQLVDRGSCLITRVNLGLCEIDQICQRIIDATIHGCELHTTWRDRVAGGLFLPIAEDRQIGVDFMGLANLLAFHGISYKIFNNHLEAFLNDKRLFTQKLSNLPVIEIIKQLAIGFSMSNLLADRFMKELGLPNLDRIHCVEPAQRHSYETKDLLGNTTCRGIWAPGARVEQRRSDTNKQVRVFHGNVETITEVGAVEHERVCSLWQRLMDKYGRSHGVSMDTYHSTTSESIERFFDSSLKSYYYQEVRNLDQRASLAKVAGVAGLSDEPVCKVVDRGCVSCGE